MCNACWPEFLILLLQPPKYGDYKYGLLNLLISLPLLPLLFELRFHCEALAGLETAYVAQAGDIIQADLQFVPTASQMLGLQVYRAHIILIGADIGV